MFKQKVKSKTLLMIAIASFASISAVGLLSFSAFKSNQAVPSQENTQAELKVSSLTIGILYKPSNYNELASYLRSQFGNKVQVIVDGNESISYSDVRDRLVRKEWDIAFALSPMLSVAAKENGYTFAARMFPDKPLHYQSALFVKSDSPMQSLNDTKPTTTVALGDFNSASSFYMPAYDLFGKTLRVDLGHRSQEIKEMVKTGKADVGAAAYDTVKNDPDLRVIQLSRQIPGSNVYLSPNLSESDRQAIAKVLLAAPENLKNQANFGPGQEPDYSEFIKISQKAEEVLKCADFQRNPVNFFCSSSSSTQLSSNSGDSLDIVGRVNGWSRKSNSVEQLDLSGQDSKVYRVTVPRSVLNQIPGASNPLALQRKDIQIVGVVPKQIGNGVFELKITQPDQIKVLELSSTSPVTSVPASSSTRNVSFIPTTSSTSANYLVKRVDDGDTIVVAEPDGEDIRVRFACIDTAEVAHTTEEKNSNSPNDTKQFIWGEKAKERLSELLKQGGDRVALNIVDTDRYGRKVAEVRLPDGTLTQEVLVREGLAMVYRKYISNCPNAAVVEQAESQAKQQQLNIWSDTQFTPPWEWRHSKKS